ncbi:MAG: major facilitator superfamily [Microgenomates group bacterium GW2011_GWC2_46_7]|nr:MAG: major facilitator superfamily [Microgenomates group bacterium GW2011_GWC2_46_7]
MKFPQWWGDPINRNYLYAFFKNFAFFSAVLIPFFTDWGHISLFQVQLLQSWFSVWVFLLEIPTGAVADKIGRKHSLILGSATIALATIVYGCFPSFSIFLLAEFLFALGYALNSGADQALLYDTLKSQGREGESKKILGRSDALMLAGMMVAAPIGSILASRLGLNAPQYLTAIPMLIASAIAWSIPEPKYHSQSESKKYFDIIKYGFATIRHNPVIRTLALDSVVVASAAYFVVWFYQPMMSNLGIPIIYFGLAHAGLLLSEILVSSHFHFLEKIIGSGAAYLHHSAILVSLVFVLAALFPHPISLTLLIVIGGGVGYTRATYISSLANKHIDSAHRATILSSIGMVRRLALVILNPIIGFAATRSFPLALLIVGLFPLFSLLIKEEV